MQPQLYLPIYTVLVLAMTLIATVVYSNHGNNLQRPARWGWSTGLGVAIGLAIFIGMRPPSGRYFVDSANYAEFYYEYAYGEPYEFQPFVSNGAFENIHGFLGANLYDINALFTILAFLYFVGGFLAMARLYPRFPLLAFVAFLGAFSTYSYGTNGLRAGVAASMFMLALSCKPMRLWAWVCFILALGFHSSALISIGAYLLAYYFPSSRKYLIIWGVCLLLSMAGLKFVMDYIGQISDEHTQFYLQHDESWGGKVGFRYDFVLYSLPPIILGYLATVKYGFKSAQYQLIYNIYIITNSVWLLCMYAGYNNRIAYLSWSLYPILLIYPFIYCNKIPYRNSWLCIMVWLQLMFTVGMSVFVYHELNI